MMITITPQEPPYLINLYRRKFIRIYTEMKMYMKYRYRIIQLIILMIFEKRTFLFLGKFFNHIIKIFDDMFNTEITFERRSLLV